ncbi:uncharacterized protein VTP21DRAFT_8300 [Calcarisporiella thermophila]|uniref:uncharacterized protein n=1 Tax=Calcarisporiella thermophila TaxID=911321 RepID=UPI0037424DB8
MSHKLRYSSMLTGSEVRKQASRFFTEKNAPSSKITGSWRHLVIPNIYPISPLLLKLRERAQENMEDVLEEEEDKPDIAEEQEEEEIETIRKERVFHADLNEQDHEIIQKRIALQQRKFQAFEQREKQRKYRKIKAMFDYLVEEEMDYVLEECDGDEEEAIVKFTGWGYLAEVRRGIATRFTEKESSGMTNEQREAYQLLLRKRSETLKKTTAETVKNQYRMSSRLALDDAILQARNSKDPQKAFEGWSQARIRAWDQRDKNPNSYYYRFNAPGEVQRKGQWTPEEERIFFKRLAEIGANGQWGIFAMGIPGRVGYQCSNFYRLLVESGRVKDPNYVLDERGKAHYLFSSKNPTTGKEEKVFRTHRKHGTATPYTSSSAAASAAVATTTRQTRTRNTTQGAKSKAKRRKRGWDRRDSSDDDDVSEDEEFGDDSGEFVIRSWATSKRTRTRATTKMANIPLAASDFEAVQEREQPGKQEEEIVWDENPLPEFIDPITLDVVEKPAMCKYGHVMGYDTWIRCLTTEGATKNTCPMTKQPLTKRDLILLTHDNIEEYRGRIVNL